MWLHSHTFWLFMGVTTAFYISIQNSKLIFKSYHYEPFFFLCEALLFEQKHTKATMVTSSMLLGAASIRFVVRM